MSIITIKEALKYGINELNKARTGSARLDTELLLCFVLDCSLETLLSASRDTGISTPKYREFKHLISKRIRHHPVAYLIGKKDFYGVDFCVNKNVLVPRPETELLVDSVLEYVKTLNLNFPLLPKQSAHHTHPVRPNILEIGTGSGCISLTLARYLPKAKITAVDISEGALKVARKNKRSILGNQNHNISFKQSDLLSMVKSRPDIVIANLPYLNKKELKEKSISQEPKLALYGGKDGLDAYRKLFRQIKNKWYGKKTSGADYKTTLFIEIGEKQKQKVCILANSYFNKASITVKQDLAQKDRVAIISI